MKHKLTWHIEKGIEKITKTYLQRRTSKCKILMKKALMSPGLYVAGLVSLLIFLPHLIWMKNHDWITITYGLKRGGGEEGGSTGGAS